LPAALNDSQAEKKSKLKLQVHKVFKQDAILNELLNESVFNWRFNLSGDVH